MARVLFVDDERVARAMYGDCLRAGGHEVEAVSSVAEVQACLAKRRYDVVVTDLLLPAADGMEVLRLVKEHDEATEVLVITALDKVEPAVRAIKGGASEYLIKPVDPQALLHAVSRALITRSLLLENQALREHLHLAEAGQRLSTTLERDRLLTAALSALIQHAHAQVVLLVDGDRPSLLAEAGSAPELREAILAGLPPPGETPVAHPIAGRTVHLFPAIEEGVCRARIALTFEGEPRAGALEAVSYLARHLAIGLRNAGRLAEVEDLAYLDDLTHLYNPRFLRIALEKELALAERLKVPLSLLFLDLDGFKTVNDSHGHLVGSQLLVEVGRMLKGCVRDQDVVFRYGGDEYVVLLKRTDTPGAMRVAERIRETIAGHRFLAREGLSLRLTTCIGVSSFPLHAQSYGQLIELADRAMYRGKRGSKDMICLAADDLEPPPPDRQARL